MFNQTILNFELSHDGVIPLGQQLYTRLYQLIATGQLAVGERLPPSRELAEALGVARATITSTYEQLRAEGYVQGARRRGTVVAGRAHTIAAPRKVTRAVTPLTEFAQSLITQPVFDPTTAAVKYPLYSWQVSMDDLPLRQIQTKLHKTLQSRQASLFDYPAQPHGLPSLREAIARHLNQSKAISASPDQVIIVSGWQQSLNLAARMHVPRGGYVVLENPSYPSVAQLFLANGARVLSVDVEEDGLAVDKLPRTDVALIYVTPSHQFPTGSVLSVAKRNALLHFAEANNAMILEEEHDSDFRYSGHPVPALQCLDSCGSVLYQGSFAKTLWPGLSLGYIVVPEHLAQAYRRAKAVVEEPVTALLQQTIADFIDSGDYERHLKRMRALYAQRRQHLIAALEKHFDDRVIVSGDSAGTHVCVRFKSRLSSKQIVDRAAEQGVGLQPSAPYYHGPAPEREFVLGYGGLSTQQLEKAVTRLAKGLS